MHRGRSWTVRFYSIKVFQAPKLKTVQSISLSNLKLSLICVWQSKVLKRWCFSVLCCFCSIPSVLMYRLFPVAFVALWFSEEVKGPILHLSKIIVRLTLCLKHQSNKKRYTINQVTSASQDLEIFTDFLFLYPQFLEVDLAL